MKDTKWTSKGGNGVYQAYANATLEVFASDLVLNEACFLFSGQFGSSAETVNAKSLFWGIAYAGSC